MWVELTVKIKTIFQEQEVNNAGIPLRVHITIVVSRLMHFKQGLLYCSAQWRRAACGGRVLPNKMLLCTCMCVCVCVYEGQELEGRGSDRPEWNFGLVWI